MSRRLFDTVASQYDAGRPSYPDGLYDAIEEFSGSFLRGAEVADVGAGTGISTRGLAERGAHVVAVDHGAAMLATLRSRTPGARIVLADANALPFADGSLDLVTFAQSWHWVDVDRAPREVGRVVRPGGAIALWWNQADGGGEPWLAEHRQRLKIVGQYEVEERFERAWQSLPSLFGNLDVETTTVRWERLVPKEVVLDEVRSKSYVEALGTAGALEFVGRERALLPDGPLREPFVSWLAVVRKPV